VRAKIILLGAVMIAALFAGLWLLLSPSFNRQADLEQQEELLDAVIAVIADDVIFDVEAQIPVNEPQGCDDMEIAIEAPYPDVDENEPPPPALEPLNPEDFPSGITPIGILTIESIDLRLPVMDGTCEPELRIAPGRVPQTAQVGEIGNAVIAGHRNYTYGAMFNRLGEVGIGDTIQFQAMSGEIMFFEVFEVLEITPDNQIAFIQTQNESIITLYTCTPIRVATHRLLVRAIKI